MKLKRDPTGAIELILSDMAPADIERIATAVLREAGPVSNIHIGGDAINCAIGTGATLTARELIVALEGPIAADPVARALVSRLNKLPSLDADLPEKVAGCSAAEDAACRAADRLRRVLAGRKLDDPASANFGRTKHSVRMYGVNAMQQPVPIRLVGTFFALASPPLVHHDHQTPFFRWMNPNQRRYPPINEPYFLPGPLPVSMSKAQVWHNGHLTRFPTDQSYFTYLAADMDEGYLEYGFNPGSLLNPEGGPAIYAKVVGGFVAFLSFLRDLAVTFDSDLTSMSVGLALRGTAGSRLEWIGNRGGSTRPAEADGFLWKRVATPGTDWIVDEVARRAAVEILEHWSYVGHGGTYTPEFADGKYTGQLAREVMPGNWG